MKKFLIVTTSPATLNWKSLPTKLATIKETLQVWNVEMTHTSVSPLVINGRVDHKWLQNLITPYFNHGYDVVGLHISDKQRRAWGIDPTLRGANPRTGKEFGDFYFWADENTKRQSENQFVQTCLHEFCHEYFQKTGLPDTTHLEHDKNPNIIPFMKTLDWSKYQPERARLRGIIATLKAKLQTLTEKPATLLYPVPEPYNKYITQSYGIASKRYPKTGRHIGTDYGTPVGTSLRAPWDGKITTAGTGPHTGNFCHFEYTYQGQKWEERWCHLRAVPETGSYQRGSIVAVTGNTGMSTGPHLHREVWKDDVRIDLITRNNWATLTVDPEQHGK
jgi:hypothetical protein